MVAQFMPPFALMDQAGAFGDPYSFANAEAEALVAAMNIAPNKARKGLVDDLIGTLKAASVWSKLDVMWVLAAHDEQAGRLNWKSPGTFTLSAVNGPAFATDRGFSGNGSTSYLDTGWNRLTSGVVFTQDNAHISIYQRSSPNGNEAASENNAGFRLTVNAGAGALSRTRLNSGTELQAPTGGALPMHVIGRRNDGLNVSIVRDGLEVLPPTAATSSVFGGGNVRLGVRGTGTFVTSQVALFSLGAYLDDGEVLSFYNACHDYMTAIGADA